MLKFVTDEEYQELLGAESIPDNFDNLVIEASYTINKNYIVGDLSEEIKYATCKLIELFDKYNVQSSQIGNLKETNIEGWSETYKTDEELTINLNNEVEKILSLYLSNIPKRTKGVILYE